MVYLFTFLEGIASFISPCILPMLPIYVSYFAGEDNKKLKALTNSISFVIGFSIVYIMLAIVANMVRKYYYAICKMYKDSIWNYNNHLRIKLYGNTKV